MREDEPRVGAGGRRPGRETARIRGTEGRSEPIDGASSGRALAGRVRLSDDGEYVFEVGESDPQTTQSDGPASFEFVFDGGEGRAALTVAGVTAESRDVTHPTAGEFELSASARYASDGGPGAVDVGDVRVNGESVDPGVLSARADVRGGRRVESLHVEGLDPVARTVVAGTVDIDAPAESHSTDHQVVVDVR
jgi:hypothetical protein